MKHEFHGSKKALSALNSICPELNIPMRAKVKPKTINPQGALKKPLSEKERNQPINCAGLFVPAETLTFPQAIRLLLQCEKEKESLLKLVEQIQYRINKALY